MTWTPKELAAIIVAAIGAAGGIVAALITRKTDKTKKEGPTPLLGVPETTPSQPVISARTEIKHPPEKRTIAQINEITHRAIAEHIARVPPFQRDSIEAHYIGLRVRWRVILLSVSERLSDPANIHGDVVETKTAIDCEGRKEDFVSLIHAAENEEIEVEGTISLVSQAYSILKDCVAYRIKK